MTIVAKAVLFDDDDNIIAESREVTFEYTIKDEEPVTIEPPTAHLSDGSEIQSGAEVPKGTKVYFSSATDGAKIEYKAVKEDVWTQKDEYTVNEDVKLTVRAVLDGEYSKEVTFEFFVEMSVDLYTARPATTSVP